MSGVNSNATDELRVCPELWSLRNDLADGEFGNFAVYEGQLYAIDDSPFLNKPGRKGISVRLVPPSLSEETK